MTLSVRNRLAATVLAMAMVLPAIAPASAELPADQLAKLQAIVAGPHREAENAARDPHRHPVETLAFFGLRDNMTVVEVQPGSAGWWTEILGPYLKDRGLYYAAHPIEGESKGAAASRATYERKLATHPELYGKVRITDFSAKGSAIAPPGSADMVLTFRNLHNWFQRDSIQDVLKTFHAALKPGGILAVEDHRARNDRPQDPDARDGYLREDFSIARIEKAGFKLLARSEINANPKDTKDHPAGVWTLPPTYRMKDQDRAKYQAIGESDRFTLTFVKQ